MAPGHYVPDLDFAPAAAGARVRVIGIVTLALFAIGIAVAMALVGPCGSPQRWPVLVGPALAALVAAGTWFGSRIRRFRLAGDTLVVERPWLDARISLAGLTDVSPDREALRGARKIAGNDGLGAISGRFRSRRLGRFRAYVTDSEKAVVLRWPDRCLVVSPDQSAWFVETVRRNAGLSSPR